MTQPSRRPELWDLAPSMKGRPRRAFPPTVSISDVPWLAGAATVALGLFVTLTWVFGLDGANRVRPDLPLTKANAAFALIGLGCSLVLIHGTAQRWPSRLGRLIAAAGAALGLVILLELPFGSLGIDQLIFKDPSASHGRVAPATALAIVLLDVALVLDHYPLWRRARTWLVGAAVATLVAASVGFAFEVGFLSGAAATTGMGLLAAIALAIAAIGVAYVSPDEGLVAYLRGEDPGAAMARTLLPVALLGPLALGFVHRIDRGLGVTASVALGTTTLAGMALSTALVAVVAVRLTRADVLRRGAELQFLQTFEEAPSGIVLTTLDGEILTTNAAFAGLTGYETEALLGMDFRSIVHPDDVARDVEARHEMVLGTRSAYRTEKRYTTADSRTLHVDVNVALVRDDNGAPSHFISQVVDMSERRRLEEQLLQVQKLDAVGQLANGIAHDFNNLLTVIDGYASLAAARLDTDPVFLGKALREINSATASAAALTAKLLSFSRTQATQVTAHDLNEIVAGALDLVLPLIGEGIVVARSLDLDAGWVAVDRPQIEQVIVNLAINARDAMQGHGRLTVETRTVDLGADSMLGLEPGRYALVSVRDDGCGMSPQTRERIFEPFFSTKPVGKGTGLGLASAYGTIKQFGGAITAESKRGEGATFVIHLPRSERPTSGSITPEPPHSHSVEDRTGRILVVEDQKRVCDVVVQMLTSERFTVIAAANAGQALERLSEGRVDLMVTDTVMPGDDGTTLARRATRLQPHLPVLFISGYRPRSADMIALEGSKTAFLGKPFQADDLVEQIHTLLEATRLEGKALGVRTTPAPSVEPPGAVAVGRRSWTPSPPAQAQSTIEVLICDDTAAIRNVLRDTIEPEPGLTIVGEATNGAEAIREAERLQPDVILLDLSMPILSGLEALPRLREVAPHARIVAFSGTSVADGGTQALARGADAFVEKGSALLTIIEVLKGNTDETTA